MGTAMNKVLKDIIVRYKNMAGFCSPYVPGYDTHGLPIELKALEAAGENKANISQLELRKACRDFALKHVDIMSEEFQRLGVVGDFEHPYLTLAPEFEAIQVKIFGEMAKKGYIYKGLKAVLLVPDRQDRPRRGGDRVQRRRVRLDLCRVPGRQGQRHPCTGRHPDGEDPVRDLDHHHLDPAGQPRDLPWPRLRLRLCQGRRYLLCHGRGAGGVHHEGLRHHRL